MKVYKNRENNRYFIGYWSYDNSANVKGIYLDNCEPCEANILKVVKTTDTIKVVTSTERSVDKSFVIVSEGYVFFHRKNHNLIKYFKVTDDNIQLYSLDYISSVRFTRNVTFNKEVLEFKNKNNISTTINRIIVLTDLSTDAAT